VDHPVAGPAGFRRVIARWTQHARALKTETYAIYLACRDPRTPWYAKLFAACVVAYAFSPIDLIPDPIPILGYLDDLILIPLGVALAVRMIPAPVLAESRARARSTLQGRPTSRVAAAVIITIWVLVVGGILVGIYRLVRR